MDSVLTWLSLALLDSPDELMFPACDEEKCFSGTAHVERGLTEPSDPSSCRVFFLLLLLVGFN